MNEKYKHLPSDELNVENEDGDVIPNPNLTQKTNIEERSDSDIDLREPSKDGPSVKLTDRAEALSQISDQISHQSMLMGAKDQVNIPNSAFRRKYKDPETTIAGMEKRQETLKKATKEALKILNATDQYIEGGYDPVKIEENEKENSRRVMFDLRTMKAKDRKKLIKKITPK